MKTFPSVALGRKQTRRGVALVLVLTFLVLITGFVLAFYASISTELVSAKNYASGTSSKQLADAATQLVIGSIRQATSDTSTNPSGTDVAWASEPGMIRTWDSTGTARNCYKLFSSNTLQATPPYDPTVDDIDMAFDSKPALFTDLNAPVTDAAGTQHYPILDPSAYLNPTTGAPLAAPLIAGFTINTGVEPAANTVQNYAPMPVRWMYVLQDGTLTVPSSGTTTAIFTGSNLPTAANPIVARIAYWTDDETCKVNINTASEGVYWDVPHILSKEDTGTWSGFTAPAGQPTHPQVPGLAICQPAVGEYQRYPGHPATTCLSPILAASAVASGLGNLLPPMALPSTATALNSANVTPFQTYYDLIPRIGGGIRNGTYLGGSVSGTVIPNTEQGGQLNTITPDSDRLFASVDEFLFRQPLATDTSRQVSSDLVGSTGESSMTAAQVRTALEESKFFLTAHSSAPEVTTFNTPRVSMWPVWSTTAAGKHRTVLDSTLAFCADLNAGGTTGTTDTPFYFTRENSRSTTDDYIHSPRNPLLYSYLLTLMNRPVPGFGGTFAASFGSDTAQVLTSIYDYIRCINMYDVSGGTAGSATAASPYTQPVKIGSSVWGGGEVLPIQITTNNPPTQGFGRFATLSGMDLIFAGLAGPLPAKQTLTAKVQVLLVPTFFSPMQGLPAMWPLMKYTITGQEKFSIDGNHIFLPGGTNWFTNPPVQQNNGRGMGSMISPRASLERYPNSPFNLVASPFEKLLQPGKSFPPSNPPTQGGLGSGAYPFVSYWPTDGTPNVPLQANPPPPAAALTTMSFSGGTLIVKLYAADGSATAPPLQTFTVMIPSAAALPRPKIAPLPPTGLGPLFANDYSTGRGACDTVYDVVRGVELAGPNDNPNDTSATTNTSAGDARMIAILPSVAPTYYHAHQNWASTNMAASGMEDDDGGNINLLPDGNVANAPNFSGNGSHGALAAGIFPRGKGNPAYHYKSPYVPSRTFTSAMTGVTRDNGTASEPGDWDTGFALLPDGAHINMGDIGDGAYQDDVKFPYDFKGPRYPYVQKEDHFDSDVGAGSYFSPNRQVPSSMVLGSIPRRALQNHPWETLLFNPKPEDPNHPGRGVLGSMPPDHVLADFFWMPVVQPYPISQPFSTAGKINMNYLIEPFTYITRSTGIYAVMKSTKMMAIPASVYTNDPKPLISLASEVTFPANPLTGTYRYPIDVSETVKGFTDKFATNDIFRSASQISEINLVPSGVGVTHDNASMASFWKAHTLSGDNLREKPYVDIYPRLTTKSNAYTVHFRVQVLQKVPGTSAGQWVEGRDQIVSEYRGSSEIERYLDPDDAALPDFASLMVNDPSNPALNLDKYYRYRVVSTKRFSPY